MEIKPPVQSGDRVLVIANPATHRPVGAIFDLLKATVPDGVELELQVTRSAGEAREIARRRVVGAAMVVVIGGDGTVADVAGQVGDVPIGIVPAGSTNITGRELGVPGDIRQAVELLWKPHRVHRVDAGLVGDRVFLHMAGAGFDSTFFANTDRALKRRVGWVAYLPAAMRALAEKPVRYQIETEKETFDVMSPLVLVANGASIIDPHLRLHREIRSDDGWLDLMVITATKPVEFARTLGSIATLRLDRSRYLIHRRVKQVKFSSDRPMPVQLDGDVVEQTPVAFGIQPQAIGIIAPR